MTANRSTTHSLVPIQTDDAVEHACPRRLDRRGFLRDTAMAVAGALIANGLASQAAFAERVAVITPLSTGARTRTYAIPAGDGVFVDEADGVVLARLQGKLFAFSIECPHKGARLQWLEGSKLLYCPKHKARFSADGAHVSGRQTRDLDRFAMRRVGANAVTVLDQVLDADQDASAWSAAVLSV